MIVRSHLPWPLRWVVVAVMLGFSAAVGLWAFEFGKNFAGLGQPSAEELQQLRTEVALLRSEREREVSVANTSDSLLKTEKAAQDKLAQQLKQVEADNLALKSDLGFFERLLPAGPAEGLAIRALHAEAKVPGQLRYQLLLMRSGRNLPEFSGHYEITLAGTMDGRPWSLALSGGPRKLQFNQYFRVEGMIDHPAPAVVKTVSVRVTDLTGAVKATLTVKQ